MMVHLHCSGAVSCAPELCQLAVEQQLQRGCHLSSPGPLILLTVLLLLFCPCPYVVCAVSQAAVLAGSSGQQQQPQVVTAEERERRSIDAALEAWLVSSAGD